MIYIFQNNSAHDKREHYWRKEELIKLGNDGEKFKAIEELIDSLLNLGSGFVYEEKEKRLP